MVAKFRKGSSYPIIEAAHMELAEPSIRAAYEKCVQQGARLIICHPYFLSKGRHVQEDIPALLKEARTEFPGTDYIITEPIGMQEEVVDLISKSILSAVTHRAAS
jgi:sirohydrochlorin ferrochelatase